MTSIEKKVEKSRSEQSVDEIMLANLNIGEDDRNTNPEYDIKKVMDHYVDEKTGEYCFEVKTKNGETFWANDSDCNCEHSIKTYLQGKNVKTIYCFCRVSSKNQSGPTHVSLALQEMRLKMHAKLHYPLDRVKVCKISMSAYKDIPMVLRDIGEVAEKGDVILAYRVDRLSRNIIKYLSFLEDLNNRGVGIYSYDEQLDYNVHRLDFIQHIVDAHKESHMIGRRVRDSINIRRARGDESFGRIPFGFKRVRDPTTGKVSQVKDELEQKVIETMRTIFTYSYQNVANTLNHDNILRRGEAWTAHGVKTVLNIPVPKKIPA